MHVSFGKRGVTFNGLLTIVFIMLKLRGDIAWSWWWVLCPLWIPIVLGLSVMIGLFIVYMTLELLGQRRRG